MSAPAPWARTRSALASVGRWISPLTGPWLRSKARRSGSALTARIVESSSTQGGSLMARFIVALLGAALLAGAPGNTRAALTVVLGLPGVNGETDAPGRPDVTALHALSLSAGALDATKLVDSTSPALASAFLGGTPYASATLSFYDAIGTDALPDAELTVHTAVVSAIQSVSIGPDPGEIVSLAFASPSLSLFLELPGITGESSAPGHPGVIALESVALSGGGFTVLKAVDSTSLALANALLLGNPFATASLLVYTDVLSETRPDFALVYQSALVSGIDPAGSQNQPKENVAFAAAGMHVVPEPGAGGLVVAALLLAVKRAVGSRSSP